MDVRFIPWDINQYYSFTFMYVYMYVLYLAEIVPVLAIGNSFSWHRYPFYISYYCAGIFDSSVFVLHFLAFWNYKMLQALLISCPVLESDISTRSPGLLYWRMELETKL